MFFGAPAVKKHSGKYYATDRLHPGVAVLVSCNLVAKPFQLPNFLDAWYQRGFLMAISVFLEGSWIIFLSIYVPLSQEAPALLDDLRHFLHLFASQPVVIAGDFNAPPGSHVGHVALSGNGFSSLGAKAPFDFITYRSKTKNGIATSAVDDILISQRLEERVMPCSATQVREFGHFAVCTTLIFSVSQIAKFEVVMPDKPIRNHSEIDWSLPDSIEAAWCKFCANMDAYYGNKGAPVARLLCLNNGLFTNIRSFLELCMTLFSVPILRLWVSSYKLSNVLITSVLNIGRLVSLLSTNLLGLELLLVGSVSLLFLCLFPSNMKATVLLPPLLDLLKCSTFVILFIINFTMSVTCLFSPLGAIFVLTFSLLTSVFRISRRVLRLLSRPLLLPEPLVSMAFMFPTLKICPGKVSPPSLSSRTRFF